MRFSLNLNKSASYLPRCLSLIFFCDETLRTWALLDPETRYHGFGWVPATWVPVPSWGKWFPHPWTVAVKLLVKSFWVGTHSFSERQETTVSFFAWQSNKAILFYFTKNSYLQGLYRSPPLVVRWQDSFLYLPYPFLILRTERVEHTLCTSHLDITTILEPSLSSVMALSRYQHSHQVKVTFSQLRVFQITSWTWKKEFPRMNSKRLKEAGILQTT